MYVWGTMRKTVIVCILVEFCAFCDTLWIFPCWASAIKAASLSINMFPWNALNSQSTSPSNRIILVKNMKIGNTVRFVSLLWANFNLTFMDHVCWAYKLKAPVKWDMRQFDWLIKFPFAFEDVRKGKRGKWGNAIFRLMSLHYPLGKLWAKEVLHITLCEC